jgi:peptidyl-prolyl cis-trans isomerase C
MSRYKYIMIAAILISLNSVAFAFAEELANINGQVITVEEFEDQLRGLPPQMQMRYMSGAGKMELLHELITREVVHQEALRSGLNKDSDVKARIKAKMEEVKRDVLVTSMYEKIVSDKMSDAQVKKYYMDHKKGFESVRASHILVDGEDEAMNLYNQLNKGADFAEMARKHSKDPSAKENGGDLGYFTRGQMVKPFEEKAFSLKVNKISKPVQSDFGYHLIKVVDIKQASKFEELAPEDLNNVRRRMFDEQIDQLKRGAKIVVHEDRIR